MNEEKLVSDIEESLNSQSIESLIPDDKEFGSSSVLAGNLVNEYRVKIDYGRLNVTACIANTDFNMKLAAGSVMDTKEMFQPVFHAMYQAVVQNYDHLDDSLRDIEFSLEESSVVNSLSHSFEVDLIDVFEEDATIDDYLAREYLSEDSPRALEINDKLKTYENHYFEEGEHLTV